MHARRTPRSSSLFSCAGAGVPTLATIAVAQMMLPITRYDRRIVFSLRGHDAKQRLSANDGTVISVLAQLLEEQLRRPAFSLWQAFVYRSSLAIPKFLLKSEDRDNVVPDFIREDRSCGEH